MPNVYISDKELVATGIISEWPFPHSPDPEFHHFFFTPGNKRQPAHHAASSRLQRSLGLYPYNEKLLCTWFSINIAALMMGLYITVSWVSLESLLRISFDTSFSVSASLSDLR